MKERTLGKTDVRLSEVALGTWGLASGAYGPLLSGRLAQVIGEALERGISTFDVSPTWGIGGESEQCLARVVADRRDDVQYITRAGVHVRDGGIERDYGEESLVADCEASLERLKTDRIDVWLVHDPPEEEWARPDIRRAADRLLEAGKIRAWGATVGDVERARMAISAEAQALCLVYNMLASDELHDLSGDISVAGCGVLARSPLAYGLLAGRWSENRSFSELDHRRDRWSPQALRTRVRQANRLRFLVHDRVHSLTAAAIRFVLANGVVTSTLVGARSTAQVTQAAECADGPPYLPDEDLVKLPQVLAAAGV